MDEHFTITTADPRFDPNEPVIVNGFRFISAGVHDQRVTELLEANNRELERRREAEREFEQHMEDIREGIKFGARRSKGRFKL
jgi:hypothetical protein